ncbi:hypothetical protein HA466_0141050 [Hirschfeldia incana]|nr:hypothetical protein HA466_0141050 [Hirschfeldia incana]
MIQTSLQASLKFVPNGFSKKKVKDCDCLLSSSSSSQLCLDSSSVAAATVASPCSLLVAIDFSSHQNHHCRVISAATRARLLRSSNHSPGALNPAGQTFTHRSIGSLGCSVRRLDQARRIEHRLPHPTFQTMKDMAIV